MTKDEIQQYIDETTTKFFILYDIDMADIEALDEVNELDDDEINEIYRRTADSVQNDMDECCGIGEMLYEAVRQRMKIIVQEFIKTRNDINRHRRNISKEVK